MLITYGGESYEYLFSLLIYRLYGMVVPSVYKKNRIIARKAKRVFRKRVGRGKASLVKLIKKVSLRNSETKNTHAITENTDLYHNLETLTTNLLYTRQGYSDNNTGTSSYSMRIGDEVIARGLQFKFWFATKSDRPNVMFKIVFFKYYTQSTPPTSVFKSQGTSNRMIRDLDTEKLKIIKVKMFNIQLGMSGAPSGGYASSNLKEGHRYIKYYLPLKNARIRYIADDSGTPRNYDYGISVIPYDSYGTLTTDIVASYAQNIKFYFKDP